LAAISPLEAKCQGVLGQNNPPKRRQNIQKYLLCGSFLAPTGSIEPLMESSLSVWPVQVLKKKKAAQEEEVTRSVYYICMERHLASGFQSNLACEFVKRVNFQH